MRPLLDAAPAPFATRRTDVATVLALPGPRFVLVAPLPSADALRARLAGVATPAAFAVWRWLTIRAGVPVITAATQDMFVAQAANWDMLDGIDFRKGCYTGQEIIARTHYLGRLKERTLAFHADTPEASPGDRIYSQAFDDQPCGTVVNAAPAPGGGCDLLAVLQLAAAERGDARLRVRGRPAARPACAALRDPGGQGAARTRRMSAKREGAPVTAAAVRARQGTHFYVYYRIAADTSAGRARIGALMTDVEARTGVRGALFARSDDPSTWMETYGPVTGAASVRAPSRHARAEARRDGAHRRRQAARRAVRRASAPRAGAARRDLPPLGPMCLALIAFAAHPRYRLVVAANRDEFHARPAAAAAWWDEGILAGRDLKEGGTWLGVDRRGRFALLTNVRDPSRHDPGAPSRGALVPRLLASSAAPSVVASGARPRRRPLQRVQPDRRRRRRALLGFEPGGGAGGARSGDLRRVESPARHAVAQGASARRRRFAAGARPAATATTSPRCSTCCTTPSGRPMRLLPATGVTLERERMLSSPFIVSPDYGTRCSTVLAIDADGAARFVERSFDPAGEATGEVDVRFPIVSGQHGQVALRQP